MSEMKDSNNAAALVGNPEPMDQSGDNSMPSPQQQEEAIKKKFGGLMPKKPPLISKDHERAYFDSADWALGKVWQNPKDRSRHLGQSCSQHANSSSSVQGALFTLRRKMRMEMVLVLRI
uniref:cAMP-regulated phosphoprotein 19-related protein n=1 Tax=Arundo donax TaxID=35708 RepID=A0A0A9EC99_ARUDO